MATLRQKLNDAAAKAFEAAGVDPRHGEVVVSQRPDLAHFQCNGALAAAKEARRKPHDIGQAAAAALRGSPMFAEVSIAGPGFVNLRLADSFVAEHAAAMAADARLGMPAAAEPRTIVIDFGGPNVAKAMHVGHLRSSIIGECLKRLHRWLGHKVIGDIHLGDWGTQMGMLVCEVRRRHPELPYFDAASAGPYPAESPVTIEDLGEMYPAAAARAKSDPAEAEAARKATAELQAGRAGYRALWRHFVEVSIAALKRNFDALGVTFDLWMGESDVQDRIPAMIERLKAGGHAVESDGALVVHVAEAADTAEVPPLILLKSDGAAMYGTTDLATIEYRVGVLGAQEVIYVVDKRQGLHFEQVFRAARKGGIAPPGCVLDHAAFGTVNGEDGKPFKTRAGGVMTLEDLLEMARTAAEKRLDEAGLAQETTGEERRAIATQVGVATVKFADLIHHRTSDYIFSLEKFTAFEGCTGPYLQYTAVRMRALLRKAAERGFAPGAILAPGELERDLLIHLARLPDAIENAARLRAPSLLGEHLFDLCRHFSRFYEGCHILTEERADVRASWLGVTDLARRGLEIGLDLLGIEVPPRL